MPQTSHNQSPSYAINKKIGRSDVKDEPRSRRSISVEPLRY